MIQIDGAAGRRTRNAKRLRGVCVALLCSAIIGHLGCERRQSGPPSFLLFVMDTTRADAVSAYGHVSDTTPTIDRLAAAGLRYTQAHAQAPWTLPSHVTLFTGLLPSQHRVTYRNGLSVPDALVTLPERLRDIGYQTVGVSENLFASGLFNLAQGFERFEPVGPVDDSRTIPAIENVLDTLAPDRPFFLFVNVMDPHAPYSRGSDDRFLPADATAAEMAKLSLGARPYQCAAADYQRQVDLLHGLYRAEVGEADAKLDAILTGLERRKLTERLISIVTADHGEHFGEHDLVGHMFSVREALLHVPLIIHGLAGAEPAVIDTPVQLADIVPTVLDWVGLSVPDHLPGQPLPTRNTTTAPIRSIVAQFTDPASGPPHSSARWNQNWRDQSCTGDDKVNGAMQALVRYPFKLIRFERYPSELYHLGEDPHERHDLAARRPELVTTLEGELEQYTTSLSVAGTEDQTERGKPASLTPEIIDQLKALGYIDDGTAQPQRHEPAKPDS
jgi:arylsulfatase A-like enzyme